MPLCCIGGVCVPYTAVFPLLALGLKWLLEKLVQYNVIPSTWHDKVIALLQGRGLSSSSTTGADKKRRKSSYRASPTESTAESSSSSCCGNNKEAGDPSCCNDKDEAKPDQPTVQTVESQDEWDALVSQHPLIVVKMTADWCQPCKTIQPYFEQLAAQQQQHQSTTRRVQHVIVDVDELDEVAAQYSVAALPTFVAIDTMNSTTVARYSGSAEAKLLDFFDTVQEYYAGQTGAQQ